MRRFAVLLVALIALSFPTLSGASTWEIDPAHTLAQFAIRHLMISTVRGHFDKVSGTVTIDENDPTKSKIEATIDTASINTRVEKRDEHLKSPDFFDVAKYPTITFTSKKIEKVGDTKFKVTGDLTIRGITKEVVLDVEGNPKAFKDPFGMMRVGGNATTTINRKDFGLAWNKALETGGVVVGDEVTITIDIEMTQKEAKAAAAAAGTAN